MMNTDAPAEETKLPQRILIVDDDSDYRALVKLHLSKVNKQITLAEYDPSKEGLPNSEFNWAEHDLVLMDYYFGDKDTTGLDLVHNNHKKKNFPPVIMLTEAGNEEVAVKSIKIGCYDYISKKTLTPETLNKSLESTWQQFKKNNKYRLDLTISQNKFSKEVFYQKLTNEYDDELYEDDRTFIVFELSDAEELRKNIGIIGRDALIKRISMDAYEFLSSFTEQINISRVNDKRFAILIAANKTNFDIESCVNDLCAEVLAKPFNFLDKNYFYRFNIAILTIKKDQHSLDNILFTMDRALIEATDRTSDLFYIWDKDILDAADFLQNEDNYFGPSNTEQKNHDALMLAKKRLEEAIEGKEAAESQIELEQEIEKQTIERAKAEIEAEKAARRRAETGEFLAKKESERAKELSPLEKFSAHKESSLNSTFNDMQLENTIEKEFKEIEADPFDPKKEDEPELSAAQLEELEFLIQLSVDENRCQLQYQPIMYLGDRDDPSKRKIFNTDVYLITNESGKVFFHDSYDLIQSSFLRQYIDQFILRELFSLMLEDQTIEYHREFIFSLREEWFTDITLYNWFIDLLKENLHLNPKRYLWFSIDIDLFEQHKDRASSLITLLKNDFGFNFIIENITTTKQAVEYARTDFFDSEIVDISCIKTLQSQNLLDVKTVKYKEKKVVSSHIIGTDKLLIANNINGALELMDAINAHINYVAGSFIAESQETMALRNNFEDFEI